MPEPVPKAELMRSLGQLVRGLSALFWGLPLTLLVCVKTATSDWFRPLGILPPLLTNGMLFYGLWQLSSFQRQERVWHFALDRTKLLCLVNVGLSPFVFWWTQVPHLPFFVLALALLMISGVLFLFNLNQMLQRLAAMLPDETLRLETTFFTSLNIYLLLGLMILTTIFLTLQELNPLSPILAVVLREVAFLRYWILLFLVLLPLAMTMTLIWKIKEVVLASVFSPEP